MDSRDDNNKCQHGVNVENDCQITRRLNSPIQCLHSLAALRQRLAVPPLSPRKSNPTTHVKTISASLWLLAYRRSGKDGLRLALQHRRFFKRAGGRREVLRVADSVLAIRVATVVRFRASVPSATAASAAVAASTTTAPRHSVADVFISYCVMSTTTVPIGYVAG